MSARYSLALVTLIAACGAAAPESDPSAAMMSKVALDGEQLAGGGLSVVVADRKVVHTGSASIRVDDWPTFDAALRERVGADAGFVDAIDLRHNDGSASYATITVRVPAAQWEPFLAWVATQGEVESLTVQATDVTAQWVDLDARLRNAHRTEERLTELLAQKSDSLEDVLAVERELARVREEIETQEAQRRGLDAQVAMSTLTLSARVETPFETAVAIGFGDEAARTLSGSLSLMAKTARAGALVLVALAPWLAMGMMLLGVPVLAARRLRRARSV
jgi:hypothetical protein